MKKASLPEGSEAFLYAAVLALVVRVGSELPTLQDTLPIP
jgi:hypothetical protein